MASAVAQIRQGRQGLKDLEIATRVLPALGYTVLWRLGDRMSAKHSDLIAALEAQGFGLKPPAPSPAVAMRRALTAWVRDNQAGATGPMTLLTEEDEDEAERRPLVRTVPERGSQYTTFAVVAERVNLSRLSLGYITQLRVRLHRESGSWVVTSDAEGNIDVSNEAIALATGLQPYWNQYKDLHLSRDISKVVKSLVDTAAAMGLRREGGVYFVPAPNAETVERVRAMVDALAAQNGGDPIFMMLAVPDEERMAQDLGRQAHIHLMGLVRRLEAELVELAAPGSTARQSTLIERIKELHAIRDQVDVYAEVLKVRSTQAEEALERVLAAACNALGA